MQPISVVILGGKGQGERRCSRRVVYHMNGDELNAVRQIRERPERVTGDFTQEGLQGVVVKHCIRGNTSINSAWPAEQVAIK